MQTKKASLGVADPRAGSMVSQRLGRHKEERGATCMHVDLVGVAARREKKSVERQQACTWGIGEHIK